jgi:hypothetical protein
MHVHSLSHKFATDILDRGGNIRAIQQLLEYECLGTTEFYLAATNNMLNKHTLSMVRRSKIWNIIFSSLSCFYLIAPRRFPSSGSDVHHTGKSSCRAWQAP